MKTMTINQRHLKQKTMWTCFLVLLCLTLANANKAIYSLPSFSLVLKVTKSDNALIVFQDKLELSVKAHLNEFFKEKIETPSFGSGTFEEIALSSKLVWRELSGKEAGTDKGQDPYQGEGDIRHFEVRGDYDCQLSVNYDPAGAKDSLLSQSIMELFLIEAFQGDNYWNLVHAFLADEILDEITGVKITVISDGYVPNNGEDSSAYDDFAMGSYEWTGAMTIGVIFAAFFFVVLVFMWIYLCFFVRGTCLWKIRSPYQVEHNPKEEAETEPDSDKSVDYSLDGDESRWLDDWADAITSIPVRALTSKRSKKQTIKIRHPAQHYNSYLDSITETDECSVASSCASEEGSQRGSRTVGSSRAMVPCAPNMTQIPEDIPERPAQPRSRTNFFFGKTQPQFDFATSQPQMENRDIC